MFTAAVQLIISAVQAIEGGFQAYRDSIDITIPTMVIICGTIVLKLGLFLFCKGLRKVSPSVNALAQDHFNDVLSNTVGVTFVLVGWYVEKVWFLDPVGAILIGLYIMYTWLKNGLGSFVFALLYFADVFASRANQAEQWRCCTA
jgi:divalent metal cation (Fe/Co/Zn/Cd) transporter